MSVIKKYYWIAAAMTALVVIVIYKFLKARTNSIIDSTLHFPFKDECIKDRGVLQFDKDGTLLECVSIQDYKPTRDVSPELYDTIVKNIKNYDTSTEYQKLKTYIILHYKLLNESLPISIAGTPELKLQDFYNKLPFRWNLPEQLIPKFHILHSEIQHIREGITKGEFDPKTERDRLIIYLTLVYPKINQTKLRWMSDVKLAKMYQKLEFYYKLPDEIMPKTEIIVRRPEKIRFYRVPSGVIMQQDPNRSASVTHYIEVTRFGPSNTLYKDPASFTGTYWYPVRGSGLFLPLRNSLIAYNKVHALKLLGVPNEDIVKYAGNYFQYFLHRDTRKLMRKSKGYIVQKCVITKTFVNTKDDECFRSLGKNSKKIEYLPEALDAIIEDMVLGKSLRYARRKNGDFDDRGELFKVYYGLGDIGDEFLAGIAKQRGIESIQLLREPQMKKESDAVIGNEIIHLVEPVFSQAYLTRLDPLDPNVLKKDNQATVGYPINYLLDVNVKGVDVQLLSNGDDVKEYDISHYLVDRKDY